MRRRQAVFGAVAAAVVVACMQNGPDAGAQSAPPQITFDPATTYQTINGWETTLYSAQDDPSFSSFKGEVFRRLVDDVGINRVRLEVRSGAEHSNDNWQDFVDGKITYANFRPFQYATVNDNSDPDDLDMSGFHFGEIDSDVNTLLLPIKQRVEARGEKLHINLCYVAFTHLIGSSGGSYHHDDDPKEYAEFVLATFKHLKDTHGLVPDSYEMILEPDNTAEWRGTQIGNALVATEKKLRDNGFTPEFVAPSTTSMGNAVSYFDAMANVSGAVGVLTEYSYHRYSGVSTSNLQAIASRASQHGLRTAMLEHIGSDYNDLHADLAIGNNSSWQQFASASIVNDATTYLWVDKSGSTPVVRIPTRTRYLKEYFLAARRGAVRVRATSTDGKFEPLGFVNANGRPAVVIKASSGGSFDVKGLPAGTYGIRYATGSVETGNHTDVTLTAGGTLSSSIPASGVAVVYAKSVDTPPPVGAPQIVGASPAGSTASVQDGTSRTFSVTAQDPQALPLTYAWTLDGNATGAAAASYDYAASGVGAHVVAVVVSNGTKQAQKTWDVTVTTEPPPPPPPPGPTTLDPEDEPLAFDLPDTMHPTCRRFVEFSTDATFAAGVVRVPVARKRDVVVPGVRLWRKVMRLGPTGEVIHARATCPKHDEAEILEDMVVEAPAVPLIESPAPDAPLPERGAKDFTVNPAEAARLWLEFSTETDFTDVVARVPLRRGRPAARVRSDVWRGVVNRLHRAGATTEGFVRIVGRDVLGRDAASGSVRFVLTSE